MGAALASPYSALYVFGDSLSDNGNLYNLTGGFPPAPYDQGRFSNGPVAAEYLAANLGLSGALRDYAIAGATSGADGQLPGTGLRSQVAKFGSDLANAGQAADSHALYMVWAGANDFIHGDLSSPAAIQAVIGTLVGNLTTSVTDLYLAGARDFLLPLLPDLGAIPRSLALGPQAAAGLTALAQQTNSLLLQTYAGLAALLPDEDFTYFDTFAIQQASSAAFAASGGNITSDCISALAFPSCTGYYYFDDIHPTTEIHQQLAGAMAAALPEPQTPALLLVALVVAGLVTRRQRRSAVA